MSRDWQLLKENFLHFFHSIGSIFNDVSFDLPFKMYFSYQSKCIDSYLITSGSHNVDHFYLPMLEQFRLRAVAPEKNIPFLSRPK